MHTVRRDQHRVAGRSAVFLFLRGACRRDIDVHRFACRRGRCQPEGVLVDSLALLVDDGRAIGLVDHDLAGLGIGHIQAHARGQHTVIGQVAGGDRMVDHTAAAFEVQADDGRRDITGHVEGIAALAADDGGDHTRTGALDEEVVIALEAVDIQRFHVVVAHVQAGAEHAFIGDDEVVAELGANDHDLVKTGPAVEVDRGVDVVEHRVCALTTYRLGGSLGRQSGAAHQRKGTDYEHVVAVIALQPGLGLVAVDGELVIASAAVAGEREAHAAAQEAGGGLDRVEGVARSHCAGCRHGDAGRAVHLADLHFVVAGASVQRGERGVVVHRKEVVASKAAHNQPRVDVLVVVDALDVTANLVAHISQRAVKQSHKGWRVG